MVGVLFGKQMANPGAVAVPAPSIAVHTKPRQVPVVSPPPLRCGAPRARRPDPGQRGHDPACDPDPFVILAGHAGGELTVPAASARAAQQAARHLVECHPHIRATWQASPQPSSGVVVVFGCARPPAGEHLLDQPVHAYPLTPGEPLPPVWVTLCGHQIQNAQFEALDHGAGLPCRGCHQRWAAHHQQHPDLPVRGRR